jgi:hypothetical protein
MNELIEIYNDYMEYNLISDKELSNKLKKKYLQSQMKNYDAYPNLFDFFDKYELKNGFFTINNYLNDFYKNIEFKIKKDHKTYDNIINEYTFNGYDALTKFLLDLILNTKDDTDNDTDDDEIYYDTFDDTYISTTEDHFSFHANQIRGIEKAIETDFATGIHSQATGCGKTIMQLKIMWENTSRLKYYNIL